MFAAGRRRVKGKPGALTAPHLTGHLSAMSDVSPIYKILRTPEWDALSAAGETDGAPVDVADGFVHFSTADQLRETAAKWFAGVEGLVLLACDPGAMAGDLRWEPSRGGALFPHLYRRLRSSDVLWTRPLPPDGDGHAFPAQIP